MPDLDDLAHDVERSIDELAAAAGVTPGRGSGRRRPTSRRRRAGASAS
jgi:hypothetical protein